MEIDTFDHDATLHASKPVLVAQYSTTSQRDIDYANDPFMLLTTPNDRFIAGAVAVSLNDRFDGTGKWDHYLNIVVPDSGLATLRIDGHPVQPETLRHIEHMSAMTVETSDARHTITCAVPIAVYAYGVGTGENGYDSYGHNCGMRLDAGK
jgi:hypothetical protein